MDLVLDSPSAASSDHSNMLSVEARLATFSDWPLKENCVCTPERMAAAGFYSCGGDTESDLVSCFHCHKMLDGWEPEDDPWDEHVKHARGNCAFVNNGLALLRSVTSLRVDTSNSAPPPPPVMSEMSPNTPTRPASTPAGNTDPLPLPVLTPCVEDTEAETADDDKENSHSEAESGGRKKRSKGGLTWDEAGLVNLQSVNSTPSVARFKAPTKSLLKRSTRDSGLFQESMLISTTKQLSRPKAKKARKKSRSRSRSRK